MFASFAEELATFIWRVAQEWSGHGILCNRT